MVQIQFSDLMVNDWLLTVVVDCTVHNNRTQSVAHTTNAKCSMIQATFVGYMRSLFWVVLKGSQWCTLLLLYSLLLLYWTVMALLVLHLSTNSELVKNTWIWIIFYRNTHKSFWQESFYVESYWRLTMDELYMTSGLKVEENIASFTIQL